MDLSPKQYALIILTLAILTGIGAYFARTYKLELSTEKSAHKVDTDKLIKSEAMLVIRESQLERARKTTSTPVLLGNKIAYIKTTESNESKITSEYNSYIASLENEKTHLRETIDKLSKKEVSKGGVKRFQAIGHYDFAAWQAGLGYRQDLGIVDASIFGLVSVPSLNSYGLAFAVGF